MSKRVQPRSGPPRHEAKKSGRSGKGKRNKPSDQQTVAPQQPSGTGRRNSAQSPDGRVSQTSCRDTSPKRSVGASNSHHTTRSHRLPCSPERQPSSRPYSTTSQDYGRGVLVTKQGPGPPQPQSPVSDYPAGMMEGPHRDGHEGKGQSYPPRCLPQYSQASQSSEGHFQLSTHCLSQKSYSDAAKQTISHKRNGETQKLQRGSSCGAQYSAEGQSHSQTSCHNSQRLSKWIPRLLSQAPSHRKKVLPKRAACCPPSIADYRDGYPGLKYDEGKYENYEFYIDKIPFPPKGVRIGAILQHWKGRYDILEDRHDYIQWIFPTRDGSNFNYYAQPLQKHEIKAICADPKASERVLECYKMMLDFYGMELNLETGKVGRSERYAERFAALNASSHNHRRITRMLKSLGELDLEHLKPDFVRFILKEAISFGHLENMLDSCMKYWVETIRDKDERDSIWFFAQALVDDYNSNW